MSVLPKHVTNLPPEQQAIRVKCVHPRGTFVEFPKRDIEQSIPQAFEKAARKYPDGLAVNVGDRVLTYEELNNAANRIARALVAERGRGSEPIALLVEHGIGAIMACLGILKAGKVLVAIDPSFPAERVASMLENSHANIIVTDQRNISLATTLATSGRQVITTDNVENVASERNLELPIPPSAPAQIVYTSGSTGQPKGIVRTHQRLLHSARVLINSTHISDADRLLLLYHLSFGAGIGDILKGLLAGAMLCPFDLKERGLAGLIDLILETKATYYSSSPSTFRSCFNGLTEGRLLPTIRVVELGSEPLLRSDVELYKKHCGDDCVLVNRFASSETGILCLYFLNNETRISTPIVPVGYPVEDREIFLLGDDAKEAQHGQVGEIAVRSHHLSTEYWRDPQLTQAKFLRDRAGDSRVYVTGDLGRMLPDGCIIYLGRKDLEFKVRGFRIAPTEIEIVLRDHPGIQDAAVVAWMRESDETKIVAYVVPGERSAATVSDLCEFLGDKLPDFMIPSAFVFLESLPLINGKLDRKALPKPDDRRPLLRTPYVRPRNEIEETLVRIWEEVLDVRPIGIHDTFFDLGGHSLLAMRIIAKLYEALGDNISLRSFLDAPTVTGLAQTIETFRWTARNTDVLPSDSANEEDTGEL